MDSAWREGVALPKSQCVVAFLFIVGNKHFAGRRISEQVDCYHGARFGIGKGVVVML